MEVGGSDISAAQSKKKLKDPCAGATKTITHDGHIVCGMEGDESLSMDMTVAGDEVSVAKKHKSLKKKHRAHLAKKKAEKCITDEGVDEPEKPELEGSPIEETKKRVVPVPTGPAANKCG